MSKHYVRVKENTNIIIHGFSDDFEQPLDTDLLVNENGTRQFSLLGLINPPLTLMSGAHVYRLVTNTTEEKVPITEDVTDEVKIDTSNVELDEEGAVLEEVQVSTTATATGYKPITVTTYSVRRATDEEIEEEINSFEEVEQEISTSEKIKALQAQVDLLTECLLEISEVVYGGI